MLQISEEERMVLTRSIMQMLDGWGLESRDVLTVLDLPESIKARSLARYRDDTPFPDDPKVMKRIEFLLRISEALRTTFPTNPQMRARWMRQANRHFGRRQPLAVILEGGENGLVAVLAHLDCTYAWDLTGSKAN